MSVAITFVRVDVARLEAFVKRAFLAMGLSERETAICAAGLMHAEMRCLPGQGQGVGRLTGYFDRLSQGLYVPGTEIQVVKESSALAFIDADMAMGSIVGQDAMAIAVDKAKTCGIGAAFVHNSTHFGSAGFHALRAVEADCIGIAMTNAGAEMAPWGGRSPRVGTNPWGLAAPTGGDFPALLDIALTTAGKGMMRWHEREGKTMPRDWALTPDGYETDDPTAAMAGALLGIGQYKGYGLSMFTDILTGVISGGGFGLAPFRDRDIAKLDVAHTFIAIDINFFMPIEAFKRRMDAFIAEVKGSELRPGFDEILVPGEIDHRRETGYRRDGAQLDEQVFLRLNELAATLGIAPLPERESTPHPGPLLEAPDSRRGEAVTRPQSVPTKLSRPLAKRVAGLAAPKAVAADSVDLPSHVIDAAIDALARGETHYTDRPGIPQFRGWVADYLNARYRLALDPAEVTITCGGAEARFVALTRLARAGSSILCPGDSTLIQGPAHLVGAHIIDSLEGSADVSLLYLRPDDDRGLVAELLRSAVATDAWIIWDISSADDKSDFHPAQDETLSSRVVTINSLSPQMAGWRLGWMAGSEAALRLRAGKQAITICTTAVSQWAGLAYLRTDEI